MHRGETGNICPTPCRLPNFSRGTETCVAVLQRCADPEESVRELVAKVFQSLWFSPGRHDQSTVQCMQMLTQVQPSTAVVGTLLLSIGCQG